MRELKESELILNANGSIYHLNLKPEQVANTVITVGDPDRVARVTKYFDSIEFTTKKREFVTQTGSYNGLRITVISTGIGTDNIDIVLNELDALVNVDFNTRTIKEKKTSLHIIRVGTSGSIQGNIPVDSFVASAYGIGLDGMLQAYDCDAVLENEFEKAFSDQTNWNKKRGIPYIVKGSDILLKKLSGTGTFVGCTATFNGFYGPQSRVIRIPVKDAHLNEKMTAFQYKDFKITNLEMETAAIYGMAKLLGHHALSMNVILANRINGTFSKNATVAVDNLIKYTLQKLTA